MTSIFLTWLLHNLKSRWKLVVFRQGHMNIEDNVELVHVPEL